MAQPIPTPRAAAPPSLTARRSLDRDLLGRDWKVAFPFIAPLVIIMGGLILWPFLNAVYISMTVRNIRRQEVFVGLANYERLFSDVDFIGSVVNTVQFTVISVLIKLIVGIIIALLLHSRIPWRNVLTGLMLLPWIVPEVVTALAWRSIYDPIFGGLNPLLMGLGLIDRRVGWLSEPQLALGSVIAVNVWKGIPFFTLLILAGLKAIDKELYEAAEVDGADAYARFRHVTLPGLKYVLAVTLLLSTISTFNSFGIVYLMTGGGPGGVTRLYSILAYEKAIVGLRFGPGAAVAFSMAPFLAIFIVMLARFMLRDPAAVRSSEDGRMDRLLDWFGKGLTALLDVVMWPFAALVRLLGRIFDRLGASLSSASHMRRRNREYAGMLLSLLLLVPFLFFVLFPFFWIVITAFKTETQIVQRVSLFWPEPWTLDQFRILLFETGYPRWFMNTVIVATVTTALSVALSALAGYALARLDFRGRGLLTVVLLVTYLLPGSLMFIPLYRILSTLGIIDSLAALIATYPTFLMPFATWVMLGYYRSIPPELEEAAMIDGTGRLGAFLRITLPLAVPALLSVTLFSFTNAWNEFLFAFVFITKETLFTLPVGLQQLVFGDIYPWGRLMGASLLTAIPVVIIYIAAQRYMVEGLTAGSVKG